jgi:hypothetical protein
VVVEAVAIHCYRFNSFGVKAVREHSNREKGCGVFWWRGDSQLRSRLFIFGLIWGLILNFIYGVVRVLWFGFSLSRAVIWFIAVKALAVSVVFAVFGTIVFRLIVFRLIDWMKSSNAERLFGAHPKYRCPRCNQVTVSLLSKLCMGPAEPIRCIQCGQRIGVRWTAMLALVPLAISIMLVAFVNELSARGLIVMVGVVTMGFVHAKLVSIVPR